MWLRLPHLVPRCGPGRQGGGGAFQLGTPIFPGGLQQGLLCLELAVSPAPGVCCSNPLKRPPGAQPKWLSKTQKRQSPAPSTAESREGVSGGACPRGTPGHLLHSAPLHCPVPPGERGGQAQGGAQASLISYILLLAGVGTSPLAAQAAGPAPGPRPGPRWHGPLSGEAGETRAARGRRASALLLVQRNLRLGCEGGMTDVPGQHPQNRRLRARPGNEFRGHFQVLINGVAPCGRAVLTCIAPCPSPGKHAEHAVSLDAVTCLPTKHLLAQHPDLLCDSGLSLSICEWEAALGDPSGRSLRTKIPHVCLMPAQPRTLRFNLKKCFY